MKEFRSLYGACFLFSVIELGAQYSLPRLELLAEKGIRVITVEKTPVRFIGSEEALDTNRIEEAGPVYRYFLNGQGRLDSIYHYPRNGSYYRKDEMRYDRFGSLVETKTTNREGLVLKRNLLEPMDSAGCWHLKVWDNAQLAYLRKISADSIIFEYTMYRGGSKYPSFMTYRYDLTNEMRSESWYQNQELVRRNTYQWIAVDGDPQNFIYTYFSKDVEEDADAGLYEVDSTGMVINDQNGFFTDPFLSHNYFERHLRFKGLAYPHADLFRLDYMVKSNTHQQLWTFDGVRLEFRYDISYE